MNWPEIALLASGGVCSIIVLAYGATAVAAGLKPLWEMRHRTPPRTIVRTHWFDSIRCESDGNEVRVTFTSRDEAHTWHFPHDVAAGIARQLAEAATPTHD
ncbi:hypothetical protein C1Y63_04855 [Corynebacterium sp. 13CS0277]|uniref:hypothetical protein n=1 Tax=Corynebacterium sp. 13CS0277 TaxID=2071994 RepID=UPI000D02E743|nr:hypothetical protein [Corynebacterium sp. 13CS0277]PRQ11741.1 hypothetical protein C1Y63_04855 [Corynebacterium sp. 13CS0277]